MIQKTGNLLEIAAIHAALIEGEKSGISDRSVDEIWKEARQQYKAKRD